MRHSFAACDFLRRRSCSIPKACVQNPICSASGRINTSARRRTNMPRPTALIRRPK